jgi:hypothetical protein
VAVDNGIKKAPTISVDALDLCICCSVYGATSSLTL